MVGILLSEHANWGPIPFSLLILTASMLTFASRNRSACAVLVVVGAGMGVGGLLHWSRARIAHPMGVESLLSTGDAIVRVRGEIISEPVIRRGEEEAFSAWRRKEETTTFLLRVTGIENDSAWRTASGPSEPW